MFAEEEEKNLTTVRVFFDKVGSDEAGALGPFYAEDVVQEEFPNRFLPNGAVRDLAELEAAGARGRKVMASQKLEVLQMLARGSGHRHAGPLRPVLRAPRGKDRAPAQLRLLLSLVTDGRASRDT
jgi:hypothetical protein